MRSHSLHILIVISNKCVGILKCKRWFKYESCMFRKPLYVWMAETKFCLHHKYWSTCELLVIFGLCISPHDMNLQAVRGISWEFIILFENYLHIILYTHRNFIATCQNKNFTATCQNKSAVLHVTEIYYFCTEVERVRKYSSQVKVPLH